MNRCLTSLILGRALLASAAGAAEAPWVEVQSPHFAVVTNAGDKTGRRTAWQFEQVRAVVAKLWQWARIESGKPVVILAARDESTFRSLAPAYWERKGYRPTAVFVTGHDRHYTALRADVRDADQLGMNPYYTAYLAYLFLAMDQAFTGTTPLWFERGLAQVLANTIVHDEQIDVGRPIPSKLRELNSGARLKVADLIRVDRSSPYYTDESRSLLFDAEAWALVHLMMFGNEQTHVSKLNRYADLVRQDRPGEAAFRDAFGDPASWDGPLDVYSHRDVLTFGKAPVEVSVKAEGFTARTLTPAEAAAVRAGWHVAMGRPAEARALADEARRDASLAVPWEVDGMLLDQENKRDDARAAFAKAVEAGSANFYVHYRLAQLEWQPTVDREQLERRAVRLQRAVELNPDSASALSFLAETRSALGQADEGLTLAQRAVSLEPREPYHRLALAHALQTAQRPGDAQREARLALQLARSDDERAQAQQLLDFLARAKAPAPRQVSAVPDVPDPTWQAACFQSGQPDACAKLLPLLAEQCGQGSQSVCVGLGWLYQNGRGVPKDSALASKLYADACEGGEMQGCYFGGLLLLHGEGGSRDLPKGRSLLQKACDGGKAEACQALHSLPKTK